MVINYCISHIFLTSLREIAKTRSLVHEMFIFKHLAMYVYERVVVMLLIYNNTDSFTKYFYTKCMYCYYSVSYCDFYFYYDYITA